jgi:hypothetical protein
MQNLSELPPAEAQARMHNLARKIIDAAKDDLR